MSSKNWWTSAAVIGFDESADSRKARSPSFISSMPFKISTFSTCPSLLKKLNSAPSCCCNFLLSFAWPFAHTLLLSLPCLVEKQSSSARKTPNNYCICIEQVSNFWKGTLVYQVKLGKQ
uniref:Uncharacterized protein n=1 Tax=Glycine max TaxID=3847 RepID=C6T5U5_SOYBN|nr:unknown [Glycine max]